MRNNLGGGHLGAVPSDSSVELFDVLDSSGHKTGQTKPRHLAHRDGDWHRAVDIWIINPERRAKQKTCFLFVLPPLARATRFPVRFPLAYNPCAYRQPKGCRQAHGGTDRN